MARSFQTLFSDWGIAPDEPEHAQLVAELRTNEERCRQTLSLLSPAETSAALWRMVATGVPEAQSWTCEATSTSALIELCERALRLRGGLEGGRQRLKMREKVRILAHMLRCPRGTSRGLGDARPDDLLVLWDEATRLEPCVRLRAASPRWRTAEDGVPFTGAGSAWAFDTHPLAAGQETADPADIPGLVDGLIGFLSAGDAMVGTEDRPTCRQAPETAAAHVPHLIGYVHPFVDGNGHTGRLLMCDMLLRAGYGVGMLLAYVDRHRARALEWSCLMRSVILGEATARELVAFQLCGLLEAQDDAAKVIVDESQVENV